MVSMVNTFESSLSPFDPLYANDLSCTWLITALQQKIIKFWFTKFDLVQPGDYLEIRDGKNDSAVMLQNFTTKWPDKRDVWLSPENYLWVRFQSDGDGRIASGFNLTWKFVNKQKGKR